MAGPTAEEMPALCECVRGRRVAKWLSVGETTTVHLSDGPRFKDELVTPMRNSKDLLVASKPFAQEIRWLSWWHLASTLCVLGALLAVVCLDVSWGVRLLSSVALGLVVTRLFVIYHDYQHGAILSGSPIASVIMYAYGILAINPPSIWNRSHDHHHRNNSKFFGARIGSYPLMTTEAYARATARERIYYAASRHPLIMALGYLTIFLYGMCLRPLVASPKRHLDSALALAVHFGLVAWLAVVAPDVLLLALILPLSIASALGAYLFYAQHNFPDVKFGVGDEWNYVFAALHSSSYIKMGRLMHWFTGNIGYHHVHHLNARIPFYRLPEAMAQLAEMRSPVTTSLRPRDVIGCLRLKLWDTERGRLVSFREAASNTPTTASDDKRASTLLRPDPAPISRAAA
jgi:omega-6 fatty acid desaturase (delta-12 desaturase)